MIRGAMFCAAIDLMVDTCSKILQRVFSGPLNTRWAEFTDLSLVERLVVFPAIILMFLVGLFPQLVLKFVNPTVNGMVELLKF